MSINAPRAAQSAVRLLETLSVRDLAAELGRSTEWLYENLERLHRDEKLPRPLHGGAKPLTWSRVHIVTWLDRDLDHWQRLAATGYRAALQAAARARLPTRGELTIDEHQARLHETLKANMRSPLPPRFCRAHKRHKCTAAQCIADEGQRLADAVKDAGRVG